MIVMNPLYMAPPLPVLTTEQLVASSGMTSDIARLRSKRGTSFASSTPADVTLAAKQRQLELDLLEAHRLDAEAAMAQARAAAARASMLAAAEAPIMEVHAPPHTQPPPQLASAQLPAVPTLAIVRPGVPPAIKLQLGLTNTQSSSKTDETVAARRPANRTSVLTPGQTSIGGLALTGAAARRMRAAAEKRSAT